MSESKWASPQDVDDVTLAFPGTVSHLIPTMHEIPTRIASKWEQFVSDWFFSGVENLSVTPKDGIDPKKALRHLKTILGSYEPKHEHKEAAVAYLAYLWFDDVKYDRKTRGAA